MTLANQNLDTPLTLEIAMRRHHACLLLPVLALAGLATACSSTPSTPAASSAVQATTGAATTAPTGSPTPMPSGWSTPTTTTPAVASPTGHPQPSPTTKPTRSSMPTTTMPAPTKPARSSMPTTTSMPAAVRGAATLAVTIKDYAFTIPGPVKAGGKITVRNDDSEIHTFTLDGKNPLSVPGHSTATRTAPTQPGNHQVTCDYHGNMHATLTVTA